MRENPPKRPQVPPGKKAVWIPALHKWKFKGTTSKGKARARVLVQVRRGHWRIINISVKAAKARDKGAGWIPVMAYERELQNEYDLAALDPIYRYHHNTDVVRSLTSVQLDPLHNVVWGTPFHGDNVRGTFQAFRVWYVVRDTNLDRHYLYGRTAEVERLEFDSLKSALPQVQKLQEEILVEYEEKAYMEVVRFVAWTAYAVDKVRRDHKKFRKISKERGMDFDPRRFKFRRVTTRWERGEAQKALRGVSGVPEILSRDYGGNYSRFKLAMQRAPAGERRRAYDYLAWAVGQMEKALDKKRKARKPGKWRE